MSNRLDEEQPSEKLPENEGEIRVAVDRLILARKSTFVQNDDHEWKTFVIMASDIGFEIYVKEAVFRGFEIEGLSREQQVDRLVRYIYRSIELQLLQDTPSIPTTGFVQ